MMNSNTRRGIPSPLSSNANSMNIPLIKVFVGYQMIYSINSKCLCCQESAEPSRVIANHVLEWASQVHVCSQAQLGAGVKYTREYEIECCWEHLREWRTGIQNSICMVD